VAPSKSRSNKVATKDTTEDVAQLLAKVFAVADEYVLPPMSTYYIAFTPAADNFFYLLQVTRELGWRNKQIMSLVKDRLIISRLDYHPHHEIVLYGFKPGEGRHGRMGKHCWYGDSKQKDVFFMKKPSKSKLHPTMKPIELMALHISNSSRMGDFVYEPFGGSGSTMIACEKLDRKCLCVELEPAYCDVIVERWQDQTGEKAQRS
jgi:DNA modification methylase